jgi:hypothetical protein
MFVIWGFVPCLKHIVFVLCPPVPENVSTAALKTNVYADVDSALLLCLYCYGD